MVIKPQASISETAVRLVLDAMVHFAQEPKESPLIYLLLVDEIISNPNFPPTNLARQQAIQDIFIQIITEALIQHRAQYGLVLETETAPITVSIEAIQQDAAQDNPELLSWSYLYYRYVRVTLALTLNDYSELLSVEPRTMRRYATHAIKRLTQRLIHLEAEARVRYRYKRLLINLPSAKPPQLYGRAGQFNVLANDAHSPAHFCITGPSGVGKTALIEAVLHDKIANEQLDDIVWVNQPMSVQSVRRKLVERLQIDNDFLREHTIDYRLCFVFDNADTLLDTDLTDFLALLADLSDALVFFTVKHVPTNLSVSIIHIPLYDLAKSDANLLISVLLIDRSLTEMLYPEEIWGRVGGNPLAIKLFIQHMTVVGSFPNDSGPLQAIYDGVFAILDAQVQRFWLIMALFQGDFVSYDVLERVSRVFNLPPARFLLDRLAKQQILTLSEGSIAYSLTYSAQEYIRNLCQGADSAVLESLELVINTLAEYEDFSQIPDVFIEGLLTTTPLTIPVDLRVDWLAKLFVAVRQSGYHLGWLNAFEFYQREYEVTLEQQFMYGVCLRNIGEWQAAEEALRNVLQISGEKGAFVLMTECLFEQSVLMRVQGHYEAALQCYTRADALARQYHLEQLYDQIRLEYAQIAFDQGAFPECLSLLHKNDVFDFPENQHLKLLKIEALAGTRNFAEAHRLLQRIIAERYHNKQLLGRAYMSLARVYEFQEYFSEAFNALQQAIMLFEQANDQVGLARAKCNLAVIIAKSGLDELYIAQNLLLEAKAAQERKNDRLALAVTLHCLDIVQQRLLS